MSLQTFELPILFQDANFVVVNKASGWLVHASKIDPHEKKVVMQALRNQLGQKMFSVHRLDKATSGALLFAKSPDAAARIGISFSLKKVSKKYLALVRGHFECEMTVDYPLKEILDLKSDSLAQKDKPAQSATTEFKCISKCEILESVDRYPSSRYSLIEARPITGRKHQIRRHLKHLFHPIIGDVNYGSGVHNQFFRDRFESHRLLLACTELSFVDPFSGRQIKVTAPVDEQFQRVIFALGLDS